MTRQFEPGLLFRVFVVGQLVGSVLGDAIAASGLSATEFGVQSAIGASGRITPTGLARVTGMPPTTLSALIGRLERDPAEVRAALADLDRALRLVERDRAAAPA